MDKLLHSMTRETMFRYGSSDGQCIVDSLIFFLSDDQYVLSGHGHSRCQGTQWYPSLPTWGKTFMCNILQFVSV